MLFFPKEFYERHFNDHRGSRFFNRLGLAHRHGFSKRRNNLGHFNSSFRLVVGTRFLHPEKNGLDSAGDDDRRNDNYRNRFSTLNANKIF